MLNVLFSDEKKFNLDGLDDWAYYWYDIRKEPQTFFSGQQGRDYFIVSGLFSSNGTRGRN